MSNEVTTDLSSIDTITMADSWPTGMRNDGPTEYGISFTDAIVADDAISALESALIECQGSGFYLDAGTERQDEQYDLLVSVHYHPLSHTVENALSEQDTVSDYNLDWDPDDVWACYEDDALVAPGMLDVWFEVTDNDYDSVLDALEAALNMWNNTNVETAWLEVHTADFNHCHLGFGYLSDFETYLEHEYGITGSPVWDDAGQTTGYIYTDNIAWLPQEVFISRVSGKATIDSTTYDPDDPNDVESFCRTIQTMHIEHTMPAPSDVSTDEVTDMLNTYESIETAHMWEGGSGYFGDINYAINYDETALSEPELKELLSTGLEKIEYYAFSLRDYTGLYTDHEYDIIFTVTFQLS